MLKIRNIFKTKNKVNVTISSVSVLFFVLPVLVWMLFSFVPVTNGIQHKVAIIHPAIDKKKPIECIVVEVPADSIHKKYFYSDVDSVVCGEDICEVIILRMFWDEFGQYQRIEFKEGDELEKAEGKRFTKKDYQKLEEILRNKKSQLKDVFKEELVIGDVIEHGSEDVDAISGATSTVNESETVVGAVWTCFTLWHWANGELVSSIRNINAKGISNQKMIAVYLKSDTLKAKEFALEYLSKRRVYDSITVNAVVEELKKGDYNLLRTGLDYIENTTDNTKYYQMISRVFDKGDYQKRVACLNSVSSLGREGSTNFFTQLSTQISTFNYQEVEMFLSIAQQNNYSSSVLKQELIQLLKSENFLIARRAYWFLSNQENTKKEKRKLKSFHKKYKERL
ncbi:hypothetical protein [Wenyingzhuangia aestuarii]|uniref:hypothetical protein n=1 Tax=Wenyingzhuangia aestuarii TaxID=1647582 RepID=UPI00143AA850|nr:hypothetical protein [Wenyingzhuangia aestuarii]NJB83558.1 hypothetical protein [Wenyingzhuangia aestuarii]